MASTKPQSPSPANSLQKLERDSSTPCEPCRFVHLELLLNKRSFCSSHSDPSGLRGSDLEYDLAVHCLLSSCCMIDAFSCFVPRGTLVTALELPTPAANIGCFACMCVCENKLHVFLCLGYIQCLIIYHPHTCRCHEAKVTSDIIRRAM